MKIVPIGSAVALAILLAACGAKQNAAPDNHEASTNVADSAITVYSGSGTIRSVSGSQVAIAHGPIAGIGWPAMTMTFTAPPEFAGSMKVGDKVDFSFRKNGSTYVLTAVQPR